MNILIFSWRDIKHPLSGGAEQVIQEHAKGWIKAGHNVTHFSSSVKGLKNKETIEGVSIVRSGYQYLGVQLAGFIYFLKNKEKFDLVIDEFHGLPFLTPLYVKKPILSIIQETAKEVWFLNPLPKPINLIVGFLGYIVEPILFIPYRNCQFMTGSNSAQNDVIKFGIPKKNISVIPHGLKIEKIKIPKKEKIATIIYLGLISKDKGAEDALKCFSDLAKLGKFNFWMVGKFETKEYENRIMKLTDQLGLANKIRFFGFVSSKKKFELLGKAHILINPSAKEGWGLVNIEANYMGLPVVSYNSAGLVDSVRNNTSGIIIKNNTPENLAKEVFKLTRNKKLLKSLQSGAFKWSKNFSWDYSTKKSLSLINKLLRYQILL